ncbi:T-cell surface glycoprotein CD8 alpha chain-like isoform X1 [Passer montanus]|uniref:T-cell surface glycoprotein CD8 alpha chain-like isoform X1 n=1 Tax=Passer montanus TaxID=9160 RepID=UPI001960FDC4|nr:T-cell surface glycoprotein CD8 alpha chain-like isoform X1 [Passer montanus]
MDMAPALLLLLTLGFCCPGIYGQSLQIKLRYPRDITQLQVGQKLELECHTDRSHGASWIRQDRSGTLHFIVFINALSRATFGENQRSTRFEASKDNTIYRLAVKSFTPQDEGSYFCVMNFNQMLHFSPGLRAFLPVTTTVAPSTPGPTTQRGITEDPDLTTPDPAEERMQENLNFFCHIFIWVPLAGALLLLLIALVITIVLCRQTRRRRCRCKRPANRKPPTKPRTPN